MSEKKPGILRRFFGGIWRAISLVRHITFNLIFAVLFIFILISIFSSDDKVKRMRRFLLIKDGLFMRKSFKNGSKG